MCQLTTGAQIFSELSYRPYPKNNQRCFFIIVIVATSFCCSSTFADDWVTLFDGNNLDGWKASRDHTQFAIVDGVIVGTSSSQTQFLHTVETYGDFELELEVKLHDTDLNSGVQIRTMLTRENANGQSRESIHGPQVDLGKSPGRSGHILNQGNGAWINGKQVADVTDNEAYANYPSGVIALQVHGVKNSPEKARHLSFRSIRVQRLKSDK